MVGLHPVTLDLADELNDLATLLGQEGQALGLGRGELVEMGQSFVGHAVTLGERFWEKPPGRVVLLKAS